ncbi:zinc finger protein SNAI1-like [Panonychus citri]|uniref:zinc finger protein SNAI1-like n=1 Tax=Panonychus citri TaxID=50023 RepID=UPI002308346A|nr:zinc finger protein SNAI1-like [Panonychus citri]
MNNNPNNLFQLSYWISTPSNHDSNSIVIAEQDLPIGFHTLPTARPISLRKIFNKNNNQPKQLVKAYISELGVITTRENIDWIHLVRLADNCFEQNLLIHWNGDKKTLIGTTIKPIASGDEIKAWFPMDLLDFLSIPFLNPINIIHSSSYQCVNCESNFNQPNPLKIHIAFDCPIQLTNYSRENCLNKSLPLTSILGSTITPTTINGLNCNPLLPTNTNINLSQSSTQLTRLTYKSSSSPSSCSLSSTINKTPITSSSSSSLSSLSSISFQENVGPSIPKEIIEPSANLSPQSNVPLNSNSTNATINSHVTSSHLFGTKEPRSHICVFCGKLYTRKYGLKIHLRTHTGHKPLSCRFCGRPFSDPSNLNKHIRLHSQHHSGTASSPYKCKKCSKILVRRRDLERHLKSRHKLTT